MSIITDKARILYHMYEQRFGRNKVEGTVNPNKITFEDYLNKVTDTLNNSGFIITDYQLKTVQQWLEEAWEAGYKAGFNDCDYTSGIYKRAAAEKLHDEQERIY